MEGSWEASLEPAQAMRCVPPATTVALSLDTLEPSLQTRESLRLALETQAS